jgi:hypothetical protein
MQGMFTSTINFAILLVLLIALLLPLEALLAARSPLAEQPAHRQNKG